MITCLGDDVYADMTIDNYKRMGLTLTTFKEFLSQYVALYMVDSSGQNRIGQFLVQRFN